MSADAVRFIVQGGALLGLLFAVAWAGLALFWLLRRLARSVRGLRSPRRGAQR